MPKAVGRGFDLGSSRIDNDEMNSIRLMAITFAANIAASFAVQPGSAPAATTFESGDTQATLIELFTSEGCSSCPPADARLSKFKSDPELWKRIVPVAFHVDYWNRLGWTDPFSRPAFTDRQRRYAAVWRIDSVYTPNFVVNGRQWKNWYNGNAPPATSEKVGKLRIVLNGNQAITGSFESDQPGPLQLEVARLGANLESDVKRGENSGRKLRHDFVVLDLVKIDMVKSGDHWTATGSLLGTSAQPSAIAAWVKSADGAPPIQATGGWLSQD